MHVQKFFNATFQPLSAASSQGCPTFETSAAPSSFVRLVISGGNADQTTLFIQERQKSQAP
jgi:hypothetical protein